MRREPDFFEQQGTEQDLVLVYIAKKLKHATHIEELFTAAGIDFLVEPDHYLGGIIFRSERIGAFFYTVPDAAEAAREQLSSAGYRPNDLAPK